METHSNTRCNSRSPFLQGLRSLFAPAVIGIPVGCALAFVLINRTADTGEEYQYTPKGSQDAKALIAKASQQKITSVYTCRGQMGNIYTITDRDSNVLVYSKSFFPNSSTVFVEGFHVKNQDMRLAGHTSCLTAASPNRNEMVRQEYKLAFEPADVKMYVETGIAQERAYRNSNAKMQIEEIAKLLEHVDRDRAMVSQVEGGW